MRWIWSLIQGLWNHAGNLIAWLWSRWPLTWRREVEVGSQSEEEPDWDREEYVVKKTDELYCEYDSTWEYEEDGSEDLASPSAAAGYGSFQNKFGRFCLAAGESWNYRHNRRASDSSRTPSPPSTPEVMPNLNFYLGLIPSRPDGVFIKQFHNDWRGKYDTLENTHTFIQWLFPLREPGMNPAASPLTPEEEEMFRNSAEAKQNLLESYKLMLDFFGIELCDEDTGAVRRAKNWEERFHNLNRHSHNNMRITRIIKCLGLLGYQHFQAPLVQFFLEETLVNGELPSVKDSALNYFVFSVLDKNERRTIVRFAFLKYYPTEEFVWCPKQIQKLWSLQKTPDTNTACCLSIVPVQ